MFNAKDMMRYFGALIALVWLRSSEQAIGQSNQIVSTQTVRSTFHHSASVAVLRGETNLALLMGFRRKAMGDEIVSSLTDKASIQIPNLGLSKRQLSFLPPRFDNVEMTLKQRQMQQVTLIKFLHLNFK